MKSLGKLQRNYFLYSKLAQNKPLEWDYVYRKTVNRHSLPSLKTYMVIADPNHNRSTSVLLGP